MARPDDSLTQSSAPSPETIQASGTDPLASLNSRLRLSLWAVFWENVWPRLFPAGLVLAGFLDRKSVV
jgi:hypothetical protein